MVTSICAGSPRSRRIRLLRQSRSGRGRAGGRTVAGWLARLGVSGVVRDGQAVAIGETPFSCFPWWEGTETREAIAAQMARDAARRTGTWIWVHHAPPRDSPVSWGGKRSYGDQELSDWIAEFPDAGAVGPRASGAVRVRRGMGGPHRKYVGLQHGPANGRGADPRHHRHGCRRGRVVLAGGPGAAACAKWKPRRNGSSICRTGSEFGSDVVLGCGALDAWRCMSESKSVHHREVVLLIRKL